MCFIMQAPWDCCIDGVDTNGITAGSKIARLVYYTTSVWIQPCMFVLQPAYERAQINTSCVGCLSLSVNSEVKERKKVVLTLAQQQLCWTNGFLLHAFPRLNWLQAENLTSTLSLSGSTMVHYPMLHRNSSMPQHMVFHFILDSW